MLALDNSAAEEAAAVRTALWSGLINGASGALVRRFRDLETERREPYFIDPFETLVGVADTDGEPKPSFAEARAFVRAAARIDLKSYEPSPERTAVLVPRRALRAASQPRRPLRPARVPDGLHRREGGAHPRHGGRRDRRLRDYSVLIVPSAFGLAQQTWERLAAFVQGGGSIVLSYGGGDARAGHPRAVRRRVPRRRWARETLVVPCGAGPSVLGALESFDVHLDVAQLRAALDR